MVSDPGALRAVWRDATAVAVGGDRAEQLVALGLPRRSDVFVVGDDADSDELCRWSVPLGAAVAPLPSSDAWFATALADAAGLRTGAGRLVAVVGVDRRGRRLHLCRRRWRWRRRVPGSARCWWTATRSAEASISWSAPSTWTAGAGPICPTPAVTSAI